MSHHLSDFIQSLMYLRRFADRHQVDFDNKMEMTLSFKDAYDYGRFICALQKDLDDNYLGALYMDPKSYMADKPWYSEFMLMGVNVKIDYERK